MFRIVSISKETRILCLPCIYKNASKKFNDIVFRSNDNQRCIYHTLRSCSGKNVTARYLDPAIDQRYVHMYITRKYLFNKLFSLK